MPDVVVTITSQSGLVEIQKRHASCREVHPVVRYRTHATLGTVGYASNLKFYSSKTNYIGLQVSASLGVPTCSVC